MPSSMTIMTFCSLYQAFWGTRSVATKSRRSLFQQDISGPSQTSQNDSAESCTIRTQGSILVTGGIQKGQRIDSGSKLTSLPPRRHLRRPLRDVTIVTWPMRLLWLARKANGQGRYIYIRQCELDVMSRHQEKVHYVTIWGFEKGPICNYSAFNRTLSRTGLEVFTE